MAHEKPEKEKSFLTPEQVERLKGDIKEKKELLEATKEFGVMEYKTADIDEISIDKDKIRQQIKILEKQLEEYSPKKITNEVERDKIAKRRKQLEEEIVQYLETRNELGIVSRDHPDWIQAVRKATARLNNERGIEDKIREWKRLGYLLDPDDPYISDLDSIRRNR